MHAMHAIHLADVVRGRLLPGSKRTSKINIVPEGIILPGCIDKPKACRKPEGLEIPRSHIKPEGLDMPLK